MKQIKHTHGPWKVRFMNASEPMESDFFVEAGRGAHNKPELGYGIEILGDDYGTHCGYPREQKLADAILISEAPNLLKLLEYLDSELKEGASIINGSVQHSQIELFIKQATRELP